VKLIRNVENYGFAKANNIGIRESKGRYICLINSDVIILDACIDRLHAYMESHQKIGILGPQIVDKNSNVQRSCMGFPTVWNTFCRALALDTLLPKTRLFGGYLMTYWPHNTLKEVDVINGCFWMIRRDAVDRVGLLDERFFIYSEDKDLCKRFWEAGWKVVYYPEAKALHFGGASSSSQPIRFYLEMQHANLQYWKKHHSLIAQIVYLMLTALNQFLRLFGEIVLYMTRPSRRSFVSFKIKRSLARIRWLVSLRGDKLWSISHTS
jgi:GT2 family glycosyltransferase